MKLVKKVATALTVAMLTMTTSCGVELNSELVSTVKEARGLLQDQRELLKKENTGGEPSSVVKDYLFKQILATTNFEGDHNTVYIQFYGDSGYGSLHLQSLIKTHGSIAEFLQQTEAKDPSPFWITTPEGRFLRQFIKFGEGWAVVPWEENKASEHLSVQLAPTPMTHTMGRGNTTQVLGIKMSASVGGDLRLTSLKFGKAQAGATYVSRDVGVFKLQSENGAIIDSDTISGYETGPTFSNFSPIVIPSGSSIIFYVVVDIPEDAFLGNVIALQLSVNSRNVEVENLRGEVLANTQLFAGDVPNSSTPINSAAQVKVTIVE